MFLFSKKINLIFLLKIFFFKKTRIDIFKKKYLFENQKLILFNKSRWSLLFIIYLYKKINNKENIKVWLPSYYCNYALFKIRNYFPSVNFIFYPINQNLDADLEKINDLNKSDNADIFINVNFFGKNKNNHHLNDFYKKNNCWLINDCTHCLNPTVEYEKYSDFSIYSPHKFYSIPSGAICKINSNGINKINFENIDFYKETFLKELNLNSIKINFYNFLFGIIWIIKRFINIFYNKINIKDFDEDFFENKILLQDKPFPGIFIKKLFINTISFDNEVNDDREKTLYLWKIIINKILKNKYNFKFFMSEIEDFQHPYNLVIETDKDDVQKIYNLLKSFKIPISTWPDLSPEIKFNSIFNKTFDLRNSMIFLTLHPQINQQLKLLKKLKFKEISVENNFSLTKVDSENQWKVYLNEINYSYVNLLNNYYTTNKFFKSQRFIIKNNDNKIGIFQTYFFNFLKFNFVRINFGPCFFQDVKENMKTESLKFLISEIYKDRIGFLFISPNLLFNENNLIFEKNKNFFTFHSLAWKSISINLLDNISKLKNNLKSNLRRDISKKNRSKKYFLKKVLSSNKFDEFLNNYLYLKKQKNFKGVSINLLKKLYDSKNLLILNAYINEKVASSVCIALHGNTATYLVGLNLDKVNSANDLLLWKALVLLKKNNYKNFDLGGVDFISNRNVSLFKSNFGGKQYKLVGSKFLVL